MLSVRQVWDTAGSPPFQKVVTSIYRGVHAVMVLYDPHNSTSFEQVGAHWAPEVAEYAAPGSLRYLVSLLCSALSSYGPCKRMTS